MQSSIMDLPGRRMVKLNVGDNDEAYNEKFHLRFYFSFATLMRVQIKSFQLRCEMKFYFYNNFYDSIID